MDIPGGNGALMRLPLACRRRASSRGAPQGGLVSSVRGVWWRGRVFVIGINEIHSTGVARVVPGPKRFGRITGTLAESKQCVVQCILSVPGDRLNRRVDKTLVCTHDLHDVAIGR